MRHLALGLAASLLLASPAAADPQADTSDPDSTVGTMIDNAKRVFGVRQPQRQICAPTNPNEIVVCIDRGRDQRVASTAETDPNSREARRALDGNIPTAPQLDKGYCPSCTHFGSVPPPVYYIDVTALPQAPEGSDADKIAKGEQKAP